MQEPTKRKRMMVGRSDRISSLPEDVIHEHIFRRLSDKDIKKMSCLSKTWYHLSNSYPILVLSKLRGEDTHSNNNKYLKYINQTLQRFHNFNDYNKDVFIIHRVSIYLNFREGKARLLDNWINSVLLLHYRFEEFILCLSTPKTPYKKRWMSYNLPPSVFSKPNSIIKVARLRGCSVLNSFPHPKPNMFMMKKLRLDHVLMDEISLSSIIFCCFLIEHLSIVDCMDIIKILRISELHKLKHLTIVRSEENDKRYHMKDSVSVEIKVPSLQTLDIKGSLLSVNIIGCYPILTDLTLKNVEKVNLQDISSFPLLRKLCLFRIFSLVELNLASNELNKCEIGLCKNLASIKIDAPNLRSAVYSGNSFFPRLLASSSSTRWHAVIRYSIHQEQTLKPIGDFLVEFSHFVSVMKTVEHLDLHFQCDWEKERYFTFDEKLKRRLVQSPGSSIGNLKFSCDKMKGNHLTVLNVLDAILGAWHPRILKITAKDAVHYMSSFATRSWYINVRNVMYVTEDGTEYTTSTIASKTSFGLFKGEIKFIFDWSMANFLILQRQ